MGRMPIEIKKQEYSCIYPELLEKTPKKILILYTHIYHLLSVLGGLPCIPIYITFYQSSVGYPVFPYV